VRMGEMFVLRKWFLAKKKVLQVFEALPAKERECRKEMWMFTMWFGGITQRASAFSAGTASSRTGRCSDKTRPFFADSHWEAEPYLFCSNQSQRARVTSYQREVSGQVTGRLSVPYQSSFGELRMGPRLRDTLDTGLCCSSQGRGQLSQVIYKLSQVIYKQGHVDINLQSTAPSLLGSLCRVTVVPFRPAHQTGETGWVSHQFGSTNVFPDAW